MRSTKSRVREKPTLSKARTDGFTFFALGAAVFLLLGCALEYVIPATSSAMIDLKGLYYPSRCLLEHCDPYNQPEVARLYSLSGGAAGPADTTHLMVATLAVNLPTTFLLVTPLAALAWGPAHIIWMILIGGSFILAASLMWKRGAQDAPLVTGALLGLLLANSILLLEIGNSAGIVVSLCTIAVWCFIEERFVIAGVLCMAVSLAIKPHDGGLIWLYFLLAGGLFRKRALQTLAVDIALAFAALAWLAYVAPHWFHELQANLASMSGHLGINDPGPTATSAARDANMVIDLQAGISIFVNNPAFYNLAAYLVSGVLFLIWLITTLKARRHSQIVSPIASQIAWFAIAAIVPLTLLSTYHRPHDAGLLMLTVPACAILWSSGGRTARFAAAINLVAFLIMGTLPLAALMALPEKLHLDIGTMTGKLLIVILARPLSLILLVMSIFYLHVYIAAVRNQSQNG